MLKSTRKKGLELLIFEKEKLSFDLLDVIELKQGQVKTFNKGRNFDALSFRYNADTVLKTESTNLKLSDNTVCYVPSMLDYTRISNRDNLIVIHFNSLNYFSKEIEHFTPQNPEKLLSLFRKILDSWNGKEIGYMHICSALLCEIFAEIYREMHRENLCDERIKEAAEYIIKNYTDPEISITSAAEKSNVSEVYFRKIFKKEFGISPKKYIINARIKHAVNLIESGYYSLGEIAEMSGFTDYKYFSSQFRCVMGVSPSKYHYKF